MKRARGSLSPRRNRTRMHLEGFRMALSDLKTDSVLQTLAQFDELGRKAFLDQYGLGPERGYFILHEGKRYDSKAIVGAAHGFLGHGLKPLIASDFSGGEKTVAKQLRALGFHVAEPSDVGRGTVPFKEGTLYHRQRDIHETY